jgi:uroporphyrinogen decarboxylase
MNSRELLNATFRGERTERMPVSPFIAHNSIYEMFRYKPEIDSYAVPPDFDLAEKFVAYHDFFGFDVLFTLGHIGDRYIPSSAEDWDVTITREGDRDKQHRITTVRTPAGELRQVMNFNRSSPYMVVLAVEKYLIETPRDFEIFARHVPPAQFMDCNLVRQARKAVGDKGLVNPCTHGAFNTLAQLRKLEDVMMDPLTDEGLYRAMVEFLLQWQMTLLREIIKSGADCIEIGGNMATSGVGPDFFQRYVRDYENQMAREIHEAGAFVVYHNCGDAQKIMHLYNAMDIDVWGYLTGPPFGDVILDEVLRVIRPNMALRGNIDQVEFLRSATPDQVKQRVREVLERVKARGNWILSTTDFPFDGQPYENMHALAEAGHEYGRYE